MISPDNVGSNPTRPVSGVGLSVPGSGRLIKTAGSLCSRNSPAPYPTPCVAQALIRKESATLGWSPTLRIRPYCASGERGLGGGELFHQRQTEHESVPLP